MTPEQAERRLRSMTAASSLELPLSDEEIEDLLSLARRPDILGYAPGEPEWEPTYDLDAAAAEGWRWKAGKTTTRVTVGASGSNVQQSDSFAFCMQMVAEFQAASSAASGAGAIGFIEVTNGNPVYPTWVANL